MSDLGAHIDPAFVLLDDAVDNLEAQPGPFANILGGEKGFEDPR